MHNHHLLPLPLLALCGLVAAAGPHWSLAEDPYAFPKYRVSFLNGLPVVNETAERWLGGGLRGGEREFLGQPWHEEEHQRHRTYGVQGIDSGDVDAKLDSSGILDRHNENEKVEARPPPPYALQRMQLAGRNAFVCLIPPPVESHVKPVEEPLIEPSALQTFGLLQPLSNSCIYHRQGWFTYAYCHNNQVRQFREMAHSHPHQAGFVPEEDPEWEAFTLGQAAPSSNDFLIGKSQRELTPAQQESISQNIEVVRTAGHRYLAQRWGDGTICDKTGRPREIEVQFHCSQDLTDSILFVKETSTCHYIMVVHTPRLCGEPGFRTRLEQREEAPIRCREVLDSPEAVAEATHAEMHESPSPLSRRHRVQKQSRIANAAHNADGSAKAPGSRGLSADNKEQEIVRKALRSLFGDNVAVEGTDEDEGKTYMVSDEDGDVVVDIQFIDMDNMEGESSGAGSLLDQLDQAINEASGSIERLEEALRAAGIDVSAADTQKKQRISVGGKDRDRGADGQSKETGEEKKDNSAQVRHEEL